MLLLRQHSRVELLTSALFLLGQIVSQDDGGLCTISTQEILIV